MFKILVPSIFVLGQSSVMNLSERSKDILDSYSSVENDFKSFDKSFHSEILRDIIDSDYDKRILPRKQNSHTPLNIESS